MKKHAIFFECLESRDLLAGDSIQMPTLSHSSRPVVIDDHKILAAEFTDVDRDGIVDLVFASSGLEKMKVAFRDQQGNFGPPRGIALPEDVVRFTTDDLNGDDFPDAVVSTQNQIHVLLSEGTAESGWAGFKVTQSLPFLAASVATSDVNADLIPDLIIGALESVEVRLGTGDGFFGLPIHYTTGLGQRFVDSADMDGDGLVDLVVENKASKTVVILQNRDGVFENELASMTFSHPRDIFGEVSESFSLVDVDQDGDIDVLRDSPGIWYNEGDGIFAPFQPFPLPGLAFGRAAKVRDVDNDGFDDIVVAHVSSGGHEYFDWIDGGVSVLLGRGGGNFGRPVKVGPATDLWPRDVLVHNLDQDVEPELVVFDGNSIWITDLRPRMDFDTTIDVYKPAELLLSQSQTAFKDLDGDGWDDIVMTDYFRRVGALANLIIYWGSSTGEFEAGPKLQVADEFPLIANYDADPQLEILINDRDPDHPTHVLINFGADRTIIGWQTLPDIQAFGTDDLNNDGRSDPDRS